MKLYSIQKYLLIFCICFLFASCSKSTQDVIRVNESQPTQILIEEATNIPLKEETVVVVEPVNDYCVECHIDMEKLIETAEPISEQVPENEGVG